MAAECPPGAFLTEASLGAAYRRAVSKRRKSDVPQGGHTPSKGATGQAQSEGARQGASVGTEGTARAETGSLAGTGPGGGVDGEVADAETLSQDEARLAAVGGTGAKKVRGGTAEDGCQASFQ